MSKTSKKIGKGLESNLGHSIVKVFSKFIPDLIEVYLDTYDDDLSSIVTDKDSLANPSFFYDDYKEALENFDYIDEDDELLIRIPTEDTFDFEGRLSFIKLLINGTAGKYLELSQTDHDNLKNDKGLDDKIKRIIRDLPAFFDSDTPKDLRFYLLHTRGTLYKTVESILGKKLITFPFSNSSPIYLFDDGIKFFEDIMNDLIGEAIDDSIRKVKRGIN